MKKKIGFIILIVGLFPRDSWSCPFCELGGNDTAYFILSIFGIVALGAIIIFIAFLKSGGFRENEDVKKKALKAEGLLEEKHWKPK